MNKLLTAGVVAVATLLAPVTAAVATPAGDAAAQ